MTAEVCRVLSEVRSRRCATPTLKTAFSFSASNACRFANGKVDTNYTQIGVGYGAGFSYYDTLSFFLSHFKVLLKNDGLIVTISRKRILRQAGNKTGKLPRVFGAVRQIFCGSVPTAAGTRIRKIYFRCAVLIRCAK